MNISTTLGKKLTHASIHLSKSVVNRRYKKQASASKDVGPAEIERAVRGVRRGPDVLIGSPSPLGPPDTQPPARTRRIAYPT